MDAEERRKYQQKRIKRFIKEGLCITCQSKLEEPRVSNTACLNCLKKGREKARKRTSSVSRYRNCRSYNGTVEGNPSTKRKRTAPEKLYDVRLEEGLCVHCGCRDIDTKVSNVGCRKCVRKDREAHRELHGCIKRYKKSRSYKALQKT